MGAFADMAKQTRSQSGGGQSRASAKNDTEDTEVIEIGKSDFDVTSDDGEIISVTLAGQEYQLDLETAAQLADDLVDANPATESPEQD